MIIGYRCLETGSLTGVALKLALNLVMVEDLYLFNLPLLHSAKESGVRHLAQAASVIDGEKKDKHDYEGNEKEKGEPVVAEIKTRRLLIPVAAVFVVVLIAQC